MSYSINHNLMADNVARNLGAHYSRLSSSVRRLSSGLRINSAADDASGLAIRELMRADVSALHQGARNANDAISMVQVADGALAIIDEKLIRMKELAEQAATGTYSSTQRLMIDSEYQAMAREITRIANSTEFNGIKLLDGSREIPHYGAGLDSEGAIKIHFGTGNDSAEDYYYISIGNCTAEALGVGNLADPPYLYYVKKETLGVKEPQFFNPNETYTVYKDEHGHIYYGGKDFIFSDPPPPLEILGWEEHPEIIKNLKTEQVVDNSNLHYSVYNDPRTGDTYYRGIGNNFVTNPMDPYAKSLNPDDPTDKSIIERLQFDDSKSIGVQTLWHEYMHADTGKKYYSSDGGVTFVSNNVDPSQGETLSRNNHKDMADISKLEPSPTTATLPGLDPDTYEYQIYVDKNTFPNGQRYYKYTDDIWVADPHKAPEGTNRITKPSDVIPYPRIAEHYDFYTVYYNKDNPTQMIYEKGGKYFGLNPDGSYTELLPQPSADEINAYDTTPAIRKGVVACNVYMDGDNKTYYSMDGGKTYFTDLNDPEKSAGTPNNPNKLNSTVTIETTYEVYEDKNGKLYFTADKGKTFYESAEGKKIASVDINNLNPKSEFTSTSTEYFVYYEEGKEFTDPDNLFYTPVKGFNSPPKFIKDMNNPENPADTTQMNLLPVPSFEEASIPRSYPEYEIYVTETGEYYYGYEEGGQKLFTNNPLADPVKDKNLFMTKDDPGLPELERFQGASKKVEWLERYAGGEGITVSTQQAAQKALTAIDAAIEKKDKIRAHLGAMQNRLENTITNLNVQAENLQAAESRISDVDVATEMTEFVRNQILSQASTAMLGQANSLPGMMMNLIGG